MTNTENTKTAPSHFIYSVMKTDKDKAIWTKIGAAWPNKDGRGFNLRYDALPLPGAEVVLREPKAQEDEPVA